MHLDDLLPDGVSYGIVQPGREIRDGTPILRIRDLHDGTVDLRDPLRVDPEIAAKFGRTELRGGELLLTVVGTPGMTAIAPSEVAGWNVARAIAVLRPGGVDTHWLHYAFQTPFVRSQIDARLNTTVQATLNLDDVKKLEVPDTPLPEQQAIAEVLGALDDKIAANRALVGTSSELRSALLRGAEVADSEPKGLVTWAPDLTRGTAPKYTDDTSFPLVINQKCVRAGRIDINEARHTLVQPAGNRDLRFGDVLVNSTGMGTLGRVGIWTHALQATADSHVSIVRFDETKFPLCRAQQAVNAERYITSLGEGSTGQTELSRALLGGVPLLELDGERAQRVERQLKGALSMEQGLVEQSETLATLRDTLLPALMAGSIRVKDAVAKAAEVL